MLRKIAGLGVVWMALCLACESSKTGQSLESVSKNSGFREVPEWLGVYQDTLFCVDCAGALTRIEFTPDNQYRKAVTFLRSGSALDNTFSTKGKWSQDKTGIIVLDQKAEKNWLGFRAINDSILIQCNPMGELYPGNRNQLLRIGGKRF